MKNKENSYLGIPLECGHGLLTVAGISTAKMAEKKHRAKVLLYAYYCSSPPVNILTV